MSQASTTLYRFRIDLSDVDRGVYETFDLRVPMHPSEAMPYLLTRILAYALNFCEGIEFSPGGLSDPDLPCIRANSLTGETILWIEVGNPSARKVHRAAKAAKKVKVYTYKDTTSMLVELRSTPIHRSSEIELYSFASSFLKKLEGMLSRDNRWTLMAMDGAVTVSLGNDSIVGEIIRHQLTL